jgi:hypothetical protein
MHFFATTTAEQLLEGGKAGAFGERHEVHARVAV